MATLTIRNLDEVLRSNLRIRAAQNGRSMEAEVREILLDTLTRPAAGRQLGSRVHQRFVTSGGVDLELPTRTDPPRSVRFP